MSRIQYLALHSMKDFLIALFEDPEGAKSLLKRLIDIRVGFRKAGAVSWY